MPLPTGGEAGRKNKNTLIGFMNNIEPDDKNPEYDSIHSYYGIIDDDNDRLRANTPKDRDIKNLFALGRYSHENYVLDPINIYFYLSCLTDAERKKKDNIKNLLESISNKVVKEKHFSLKDIYQEIQKPIKSEETRKGIEQFLQMIVDSVKEKVFEILFADEKTFFNLSFKQES